MWEWLRHWMLVLMGVFWMLAAVVYLTMEKAHVVSGVTLMVAGALAVGLGFLFADWDAR